MNAFSLHTHRKRWVVKAIPVCWLAWTGCLPVAVQAESTSNQAPTSNYNAAVSTSARLDFRINMGKFLFFQVGSGTFPTASSTVDTVTFTRGFATPAGITNGNKQAISWDGTAPVLSTVATSNAVLPVEVRSNAGQVSIRASISSPLSNGTQTIPFSDISISSSSDSLPAPPVPATGTGTAVNVVGTAFSNLVTQRTAHWTFTYNSTTSPAAGTYSGQILFTASAP